MISYFNEVLVHNNGFYTPFSHTFIQSTVFAIRHAIFDTQKYLLFQMKVVNFPVAY